jgi:hypothetical protein
VFRVLEPALRMKAQADSSSEVRKVLFVEKRKAAWWDMQGTQKPVVPWVRVGFIDFLCIA